MHHLERGQLYELVAAMLAAAGDADAILAARVVLLREASLAPQVLPLVAAMTRGPGVSWRAIPPAMTLVCADPDALPRIEAHAAASLVPSANKMSEIRTLSALAHQTGRALRRGDVAHAAELNDCQAMFLERHAAGCLRILASELVSGSVALYVVLGRSLHAQLASDVAARA